MESQSWYESKVFRKSIPLKFSCICFSTMLNGIYTQRTKLQNLGWSFWQKKTKFTAVVISVEIYFTFQYSYLLTEWGNGWCSIFAGKCFQIIYILRLLFSTLKCIPECVCMYTVRMYKKRITKAFSLKEMCRFYHVRCVKDWTCALSCFSYRFFLRSL